MSIVVTSNSSTSEATASQGNPPQVKPSEKTESKSAPVADQAAEQSKATESDTEEKETTDDSQDDGDESESSDGSADDKPKKKSGSQRRKERAERAEAEVDRLRRMVEEMALKGAGASKPESKVETPKANAAGEPEPEDFETHREYVKALTKWEIKQDKEAEQKSAHKAKLETEQKTLQKTHIERVTSFKETAKDFDEVIETVDDIEASAALQDIILSSDNGPELMYELAKNRSEFERINALPPVAAARELGKFEAKLSPQADSKPEIKTLTKAPKPIAPVGSKGGVVEKSIFDVAATGSQSEYEAIRRKQMKQRSTAW
jgi:hypothetical protein